VQSVLPETFLYYKFLKISIFDSFHMFAFFLPFLVRVTRMFLI